jgi:copper(I)-binding protein
MKFHKLAFVFIYLLMLTACGPAENSASIEITDAWVRAIDGGMGSMDSTASALFMTIQNNNPTSDVLLKVKSDVAAMVQIHFSEVDANGVSSMHEVDGVEIAANGIAELKSGGYHVMLMGLKQDIKEGELIEFTLVFQNAGEMVIEAVVRTP